MSNKHNGIIGRERHPRKTVNVGYGNFVLAERIVTIVEAGSLPMKRLRERAQGENLLVDATAGRKTRSIIATDSRHIILSAMSPATLQERLQEGAPWLSPAQLELEEGEFIS